MKTKTNILYWAATGIIFLFDGVMPALTSQSELAKEGLRHLQYPEYFGTILTGFKVVGGLLLIVPAVPKNLKEWAYAGFGISMMCASISYLFVDGPVFFAFMPWIFISILAVSYATWKKRTRHTA